MRFGPPIPSSRARPQRGQWSEVGESGTNRLGPRTGTHGRSARSLRCRRTYTAVRSSAMPNAISMLSTTAGWFSPSGDDAGPDRKHEEEERRLTRDESDGQSRALEPRPGAGEDYQHRSQGERARRRHESEEQDAQREMPGRARCLSTNGPGVAQIARSGSPGPAPPESHQSGDANHANGNHRDSAQRLGMLYCRFMRPLRRLARRCAASAPAAPPRARFEVWKCPFERLGSNRCPQDGSLDRMPP